MAMAPKPGIVRPVGHERHTTHALFEDHVFIGMLKANAGESLVDVRAVPSSR